TGVRLIVMAPSLVRPRTRFSLSGCGFCRILLSGGTFTDSSGTFFGSITMKMMSSTRHTSTRGVTLISLWAPLLEPPADMLMEVFLRVRRSLVAYRRLQWRYRKNAGRAPWGGPCDGVWGHFGSDRVRTPGASRSGRGGRLGLVRHVDDEGHVLHLGVGGGDPLHDRLDPPPLGPLVALHEQDWALVVVR